MTAQGLSAASPSSSSAAENGGGLSDRCPVGPGHPQPPQATKENLV